MKQILIATDLSDASRNAGLCGPELARAFNTHVMLLHACRQISVPVIGSLVILTLKGMKQLAQQRLDTEKKIINPENRINVETYYKEN